MKTVPRDGKQHRKPRTMKRPIPRRAGGSGAPLNDPASEKAFGVCSKGHPQCQVCDWAGDWNLAFKTTGSERPPLPRRWRR